MSKKSSSEFIDIKSLINQYVSKWYLFVITVAVTLGLAFVYLKIRKPTYGVRANVLIQVDNSNPLSSLGAVGDLLGSKGRVDDELYVISSHSLYRNVAKKLGINQQHYVKKGLIGRILTYPDAPLEVIAAPELSDTIRTGLTFKVKVDEQGYADIEAIAKKKTIAEVTHKKLPINLNTVYGTFTIAPTKDFLKGESFNDRILFTSYDVTAEQLGDLVKTNISSKKANAIGLGIDTHNPAWGTAVLNAVIEQYNLRGIKEKNLQGEKTANFIKDRLALLSTDLAEAEMNIQNYKDNHHLIDVRGEGIYQTEKRGELETALLQAETKLEVVKMTLDFIQSKDNAYSLIPAAGEDLSPLIKSYNELVIKRMDVENSARPNNNTLKVLNEQLDKMRENIIKSIEGTYKNAQVELAEVKANKSKSDSRLREVPQQEREFIDLQRQQQVKQTLYTFLLQRNEETAMLLANAVPKGIIVDNAYTLSAPLGIGNKMILFMAFLVGIALTPAYLYLKKIIREKFETREEAEKIIDAPVLGEMCNVRSGEKLVVGSGKFASEAELFSLMRTNLLFMLNDKNDKVVLVTSSRSGEGKSFISINLAASLAKLENKKVLLVGMDIRKPQLSSYLGIAPSPGLTEYLVGAGCTLKQLIRSNVPVENMDIIVAGPTPPNPAELLASTRVDELFRELRTMYDYIIIDSAPIGMVSDSFSLNRVADACVLVTRVNYSKISDLNFINAIYEEKRLKKVSVIINGTTSKAGYGYGYGHGHKHSK